MKKSSLSILSLLLALLLVLGACNKLGDPISSVTTTAPPLSEDCLGHADGNDDGRCDSCRGSVLATVDFYTINDLHGKFADTSAQPGVDELTAYLKDSANRDRHSVFLSSGDMWQGSSESNLTEGMIVTDWMNELDFVAMTLGNHEFDWGEEPVKKNAEAAEFPFLGINIYNRETNQRVDYAEASTLITRGGAQIGIIGAIGDCYSSIAGEKVEDIYFKVGADLTALVKAEAQRLREAGADYIVYSLHDGYGSSSSGETFATDNKLASYYNPLLSDGSVDLVFEGHSHQRYVMVDSYGVHHLQGGGDNKGISHAEVSINFAGGTSRVRTAEFVPTDIYQDYTDDSIVSILLEKYKEQVEMGNRVVGTNPSYRSSNSIKQLVADLYYQAGVQHWGDEYDIALGGGFISVRSPYELGKGQVTYGTLQMLLPFDNRLMLCSIKGSDLKKRFIDTTNDNYFVCVDKSITANIDPNGTYYIVTDSYCSGYAPNRLTVVAEYEDGIYARDLVADWLAKQ
ncbi:MAG: bifunctional metallophosphatase/5'-nucleotidase [Clostridia bacterium]|nr:bifunctional metallophosphatase/5'-nucleotidase [Clostridia bacterium]